MTPVLYVAGSGRNGSTILAAILGSNPSVVSVGEMYYLWDRGFVENRLCGCGVHFLSCPFWHDVMQRAEIGGTQARDALRLRDSTCRTRHALLRSDPGAIRDFQALLASVYRAVQEVAGAELVVDSSKLPVYGRVLEQTEGIDLVPVLLVRDPRAVAYSWSRLKRQPDKPGEAFMTRHGLLSSSSMWLAWNTLALKFWGCRTSLIRYEDFAADPESTVRTIGRRVQIPLTIPRTEDGAVQLIASHTVSGNPVRFTSGSVAIVPDEEWRSAMPRIRQVAVSLLTLPVLLRVRYPLWPGVHE